MPSHIPSKRENHYQNKQTQKYLQRAKEDAVLARFNLCRLVSNSGLRLDSTEANLIAFLLLTVAISAVLPQAESLPGKNTTMLGVNQFNGQFQLDQKVVIEAVTQPTNTYGLSDIRLQISRGLCNTTKLVGERSLFFKCSVNAGKSYSATQANYENDVAAAEASFQKLREQRVVKCKLNAIFKNPQFHVRMVLPKDLVGGKGDAQYDARTSIVAMLANTANTPDSRRVLQNMIHSGFLSSQNKHFKRCMLDETHGGIDVYDTRENYLEWLRSIKEGAVNIYKYARLLEAPFHTLNQDQQVQLAKFKEVTANYQPYTHMDHVNDLDALNVWVSQGYIDKNYQVKGSGFFAPYQFAVNYMNLDYKSPDLSAQKYMISSKKSEVGDYYIFSSRSVKDVSDTASAALNDGIIMMSIAFDELNLGQRQDQDRDYDLDAYLHELYEPYPQLFSLLFSELQKYHLSRTTEEYRNCLRM